MNFGFNEEQELLRNTARKFFENECPSDTVRKLMETPEGISAELWKKLAEQGWLGLIYPEPYDGTALGLVDLVLLPKGTKGLAGALLPPLDQARKLCEVACSDVTVDADALLGAAGAGWTPLSRVLDRATVALCAEMCGGAQKVLDMTVEDAKIRQAFGRPIGSYQGVKHRAADMLVDVENSKSITYYAAWALDENSPEAPLAVSMAKAYVSDAFRRVAAAGIQLHGGIGFTWEHDLPPSFKPAKGPEFTFGDATHHRERVAQLVNL